MRSSYVRACTLCDVSMHALVKIPAPLCVVRAATRRAPLTGAIHISPLPIAHNTSLLKCSDDSFTEARKAKLWQRTLVNSLQRARDARVNFLALLAPMELISASFPLLAPCLSATKSIYNYAIDRLTLSRPSVGQAEKHTILGHLRESGRQREGGMG